MLLAVVPAHNEGEHIGSVVRDLFNHLDRVVVVDDDSEDNTAAEAQAAGATVLRHELNRGQGAALQTGHEYGLKIGADYVLHFDGDGQFKAEEVGPALAKLKESGADILFGSRFLGRPSNLPWLKKYFLFPLGRLFHKFSRLELSDVHNGFRILTRRALEKITITQDRMAHATEIPLLAKKHNLRYIEFPVTVVYREYGQGIRGGIKIIKDLFIGRFTK